MVKGTISNILKFGPVGALTGPVARGDVGVVERGNQRVAGVGWRHR